LIEIYSKNKTKTLYAMKVSYH